MTDEFAEASDLKVAVATGGSRGLGRSTVISLARSVIDTVFTYKSNRQEALKVAAIVRATGRKAVALQRDTSDVSSFEWFAAAPRDALAELGPSRFDYLVSNAGTSHHNAFEATTEDELDALYNVHFKGVFFRTQRLLPLIKGGGLIVNISSGLTRIILLGSASYGAIKGAVEVLTRYLAKDLAPWRIAVNVVAPGAMATDFSGGMVRDNPAINKWVAEMTALGRAGVPDDIGPLIASLLSEARRWVNAQRIEVSGGMSI